MEHLVAKLEGPRSLKWETQLVPDGPLQSRQIACRTLYSAISPGTEVAAYVGLPPLRPGNVYPRLVGYCNLALVTDVGTEVSAVARGDYVLTHQSHRSGFICAEEAVLCRVDKSADMAAVSTAYLFHLGYAGLLKADFRPGHHVAVVGLGPLGLGAIGVVSACGGLATAYSNQKDAAAKATEFGAVRCFRKDDPVEPVFDIVVTTSNSWDDWQLALKLARFGGTIAVLGFPGRGEDPPGFNPLASEYVYDKQLTITACGMVPNLDVRPSDIRFTIKRNLQWLVHLIQSGKIPAHGLISEIVSAPDLDRVYGRLADREPNLITAVLKW